MKYITLLVISLPLIAACTDQEGYYAPPSRAEIYQGRNYHGHNEGQVAQLHAHAPQYNRQVHGHHNDSHGSSQITSQGSNNLPPRTTHGHQETHNSASHNYHGHANDVSKKVEKHPSEHDGTNVHGHS